jgi:hypothetical protein
MGYLIEPAGGELVKFTTFIDFVDMIQLNSVPYQLTPTVKPGFTFCLVSAFIQTDKGTFSTFSHMWITQTSSIKAATFGRTAVNQFTTGKVSNFIVNIDHGTTPTNVFGSSNKAIGEYYLEMDLDDTSGTGSGFLTMYGYYIPDF